MVLSKTWKLALTFVAAIALLSAQDPPKPAADAKPQKVAKDQAEADLINGIAGDKDPAHRLQQLQKWLHDYPETQFASERTESFLVTYSQLGDCRGASKTAADILKSKPDHDLSIRVIIGCIYQIKGATDDEYATAEKAAQYVIDHPTKAAGNTMSDKDWTDFVRFARNVPPFIDQAKKNDAKLEADTTAILKSGDPGDAQCSVWLATVLFSQRAAKPENQPPAIFEYARAGVYDGPGALAEAARKQFLATAQKYYNAYHGSAEGWDKVAALAKANALPPADFSIDSTADIARKAAEAQAAADAADPIAALWRTVKEGLTKDGDAYWANVKDSGLPSPDGSKKFTGKLVSQKPALNPKTLVIAYRDPAGDITLHLETPLHGKMDPGAELSFFGVAEAYQVMPTYMLTLKIGDTKTDIEGWKSLPIAPARGRGTPVKKQP